MVDRVRGGRARVRDPELPGPVDVDITAEGLEGHYRTR